MTWFEVAWGLFTIGASAAGSWLVAKRTLGAERASGAHVAAVERLLPALAALRSLLHRSVIQRPDPADVAALIDEFEAQCLQHDVALPKGLRGARREVRAALGNYFGGVCLAAVDARMSDYPLAEPDPYWLDISLSYLEYVMAQLQLSVVAPRQSAMLPFYRWRSDEDQDHRQEASRRSVPGRLEAVPSAGLTAPLAPLTPEPDGTRQASVALGDLQR